jgi:hypothetical protein
LSFLITNLNWGISPILNRTAAWRRRRSIRAAQTRKLAATHRIVIDQAAWLFIVHDLNPRALSKKVLDFHPAQSRFQGLYADNDGPTDSELLAWRPPHQRFWPAVSAASAMDLRIAMRDAGDPSAVWL